MKSISSILPFALAGVVLLVAAPSASAALVHGTVVDPPITGPTSVNFQPCEGLPIPSVASDLGYTDCLSMSNGTSHYLTTFDFTMPIPVDATQGDGFQCDTVENGDATLAATDDCALESYFGIDDTSFTMSFFAADGPGVAPGASFFLLMDFDGLTAPQAAHVNVGPITSVPEPGALGLFGLGLLAIGVGYGWEKRRQGRRANNAA